MRNEQAALPRIREGEGVAVHSVFYTIQGEGPFAGRPAVFIRLWGCNLQCPWCDTDYTSTRRDVSVLELVGDVRLLYGAKYVPSPLVVITGGEPLRQPIGPLMTALVEQDFTVQVETNGTLPPAPTPDHVRPYIHYVVSPKTGSVHPRMAARALAYKYVMDADQYDERTGLPLRALDHAAHPKLPTPPSHISKRMTFIQPMDPDPDGRHLHACLNSVMDHGNTLCLQTHKIVGVP